MRELGVRPLRVDGRPVLLDGCCKAGGATKGYQRAGFYVVGVDRAILGQYHGEPVALPEPLPRPAPVARKPRRPIAPIPQPVRWGPPLPFERRKFNADLTRRRGCEVAAGIQLIGEL